MPLPPIQGIWRVGSDPELKFAASGTPFAKFRAVASSAKQKEDGSWEDTGGIWVTVIAFHGLAEFVVETVSKGIQVHLSGRIQAREWQTDSGEKRLAVEVIADSISPAHVKDRKQQQKPSSGGGDPWGAPANNTDEPPFLVMPERTPFH